MFEIYYNQLMNYFSEQITACTSESAALRADSREDEAVFQKIRLNVFDIFRTVAAAGCRLCGEDNGKLREYLLEKLEQISGNWKTAYDAAVQHGDSQKAHIERLKLDTASEIRQKILDWSEAL